MSITINSYSLSVDGLAIAYQSGNHSHSIFYDPRATCSLFEQLNLIQSFDLDQNQEPIILFEREHDYEDEMGIVRWTIRTGYCTWFDLVASLTFTKRQAELIVEDLVEKKGFQEFSARIINLLNPLNAA